MYQSLHSKRSHFNFEELLKIRKVFVRVQTHNIYIQCCRHKFLNGLLWERKREGFSRSLAIL